jgi:ADP-ribosylation factor GTPase-activating protein 1
LERARDPALRAVVNQYTARAAELGRGANDWGRRELGVDVVNSASSAWSSVRGGAGGPGGQGGYGRVEDSAGRDDWSSYRDDNDGMYHPEGAGTNTQPETINKTNDWDDWNDKGWSTTPADSATTASAKPDSSKAPTTSTRKNDEWEDW